MPDEVVPKTQPEALTLDAVRTLVIENQKKTEEAAAKAVRDAVTEFRKDDTARLKELADAGVLGTTSREKERFYGEGARFTDPRAYEYEALRRRDPQMAIWRTPDSDQWIAEWIRAMSEPHLAANEPRKARALDEIKKLYGRATLAEGTTTAASGLSQGTAGELIPLPLAQMIFLVRSRASVLLSRVETLRSSNLTLRVPSAGAASLVMVLESGALTQGEPSMTVPGPTMLSKKKCGGLFRASKESVRDSAFDLARFFAERAGTRLGAIYDEQICTSNGTAPNITESLESATITEVTEATSTVLTYKDAVNLYYGVPKPHRRDGIWMGGSQMMGFLTSLLIVGGMGPAFLPGGPSRALGDLDGEEGRLLGKPVLDVPFTAGSRLMFGDLKQYALLLDDNIEINASEHSRFANDEFEWKITARFDGAVIIEDAFRSTLGITSVA